MTEATRFHLAAITLIAALSSSTPAGAACPQSPCDCVGEARSFAGIGARTARLASGRYGSGAEAEGDLCAPSVVVSSVPFPLGSDTSTRNLVALKPTGIAAIITGGSQVAGDVVTGGGGVIQKTLATISGVIDTSGTDPRLASCAQAIADAAAASALLAALPPTRDLGSIRLRSDLVDIDNLVLHADPGVNVWTATEIQVRAPYPDFIANGVHIVMAPDTDAVIINTSRLKLNGVGSGIYVSGIGEDSKLVVNVPGAGPTVVVKGYGEVEGFLLAPERTVRATAFMSPIFAGQLRLQGGTVDPIACP
jgi:choice-of-anchor A domain-containing protein